MDKENTFGLMDLNIMGNGEIINYMDKVLTHGLMEENIKGDGKIQTCTDKENTRGKMVGIMKENITTIKNTGKEHIDG